MAPPRKHDTDRILDAARELALRDGPRAVSVAAIARQSGAPAGTLYHRFSSRDGILAAAWQRALERFHVRWLEAAQAADPSRPASRWPSPSSRSRAITPRTPGCCSPSAGATCSTPTGTRPTSTARSRSRSPASPSRSTAPPATANASASLRALVDLPYAAVRRHRQLPPWLEEDVAAAARTSPRNLKGTVPFS